jgi:outer membrane cobalamin receptor
MKHIIQIVLTIILLGNIVQAQNQIHIFVSDEENNRLSGANIYWKNAQTGTTSDTRGVALLSFVELPDFIIVSYIGFKNDTILVTSPNQVHFDVILNSELSLDEFTFTEKQKSYEISVVTPLKTEIINEHELTKGACCDLSESFETNASVDVEYTDAITGAKEINFLGLGGVYALLQTENVATIRGLASSFGLNYIPGSWIDNIKISKGAGSVTEGYESITGSIALDYKDVKSKDKVYIDAFGNHFGRFESNIHGNVKVNDKWSSFLAGNVGLMKTKIDKNKDSFLDFPLTDRYIFLNKWDYQSDRLSQHFLVKGLYENRIGGQTNFVKLTDLGTENSYGLGIKTKRVESFYKAGYRLEGRPQSISSISSFIWHDEENVFGKNLYSGSQINFNTRFIYKSIVKSTFHNIQTGVSFIYDKYDERYNDLDYFREEFVPGVFAEYTYNNTQNITLVAGIRFDYHNLFGFQYSPRVHAKFDLSPSSILRVSGGRGFRTVNVFGENKALFASSRELMFENRRNFEAAWNYGISFTQKYNLANREGHLSVDFFRTDFEELYMVDIFGGDNMIRISNTKSRAYSNSFLVEAMYELVNNLDIKIAYKLDDVKATFNGVLLQQPTTYRNKGLIAVSYTTPDDKWQLDINTQIHGKHALSDLESSVPFFSPRFVIMNMKVEHFFNKGFSVYVGGENITYFTQPNPIIGADNPFGELFDASQVWGPIVGGMFYGGVRYRLKK